MSDVSTLPITSPLTPDPYYAVIAQAKVKILAEYGTKIKTDKQLMERVIYQDNFISEECSLIIDMLGHSRVEKFKKGVMRDLTCFIAVDSNKNILVWKKTHRPCGNKSCNTCAPKKASERLRYPNTIIMMSEVIGHEEGVKVAKEMNSTIEAYGYDFFAVSSIPSHDGRSIISVACLRYDELNPLIEDNEVKQGVEFIAENYPELEFVDRTPSTNTNKFETTYITKTNKILITTTDLYKTMPEGQNTARERGKKSGLYFNAELGVMVHMTKAEKEKKRDEEEGIVVKFNVPSPLNDIPSSTKEIAIKNTIKRTSDHSERAVFMSESDKDLNHNVKRFSSIYIDELQKMGYVHPEIQTCVRLTQKDIDEFNAVVAIPQVGKLPENILDIDFGDLYYETHGLRDMVRKMRRQRLARTQEIVMKALTHDELTKIIIGQITDPPE